MKSFNSPLEGALYCAGRGFHVFPLARKGDIHPKTKEVLGPKSPAIGFTKWYDRATTDAKQIKIWAAQEEHKGCGWGVAVFSSNCIALDLDTKEAHGNDGLASFEAWKKEVPFPRTFAVKTPSGGFHLYFRVPEGTVIRNPKPRPGIEVKGYHGYVVAPGTVIDGKQYAVYEDCEPAELPEGVDFRKGTKKASQSAVITASASSDDFSIILSKIACFPEGHIQKGKRDDMLYAIGNEWNEMGMGPAARLELFRLLGALGKIEQPRGDEITESDFIRINDGIERNKKQNFGTQTLAARFGKNWVGAGELEASDIQDPELLIEGMLCQGISLITGSPKLGKTNLVLDIGYALATGTDFLGHAVKKPKRVLIGYLEGSEAQVKKRMRMLRGEDYKAPENLMFFFSMPPLDKGGIEAVRALCADAKPDVIVFDMLQKIRCVAIPKGLNAYERDYREFDYIRREIVDALGVSVILTHHNRKGDPRSSDSELVSGSIGIAGSVNTQLTLKGKPQNPTAMLSIQGRDVEALDIPLKKRSPLGFEVDAGGPILVPKGEIQEAIYNVLKEHRDGLKAKEIANLLRGKVAENAVKVQLSRWYSQDLIGKTGASYWLHEIELTENQSEVE